MLVDTNAYIMSFITIILGFIIRDFLIPLIVWRKYLKDKSYSYRFWFCIITQAALLINLVLLLGYFDICNRYTVLGGMTIVYGLISWNYSDKRIFKRLRQYPDILWEMYKKEKFFLQAYQWTTKKCKELWGTFSHWPIHKYILKNWIEIILFGSIIIYNFWFLTYDVMLYHCYQASDIPVHQAWIFELEHGTLFSDGIYPFGMHAMIYVIRMMFNFNLREILLYAGVYQTILMIIGMYLLAKQFFCGKYSPLAAVVLFSLIQNQNRFAISLPQEAGMFAVIGLAYFLLRYLHSDRKKLLIEGDSRLRRVFRIKTYINRRYITSELILFMLCVSLVIAYHFYTAIAAFILCIAIGISYVPRILKKQYFVPIIFCGMMGVFIAVAPFVACLAKGMQFQASMDWATSIITGKEWEDTETVYLSDLVEAKDKGNLNEANTNQTVEDKVEPVEKEQPVTVNIGIRLQEKAKNYLHVIKGLGLYKADFYQVLLVVMIIGFVCSILMRIPRKIRIYGYDYQAILLNMMLLFTIAASVPLGIIEIIEYSRAAVFAAPYIGIVLVLPIDFLFRLFGMWKNRYYQALLRGISLAVCFTAASMVVELGWYHDFYSVFHAYYNEAEYALRHIKQSYEKNTYTIVSPTDEYLDVLDYGYHTELSEFINMVNGEQPEYTFPTENVFFFIEKKVIDDYSFGSVDISLEYAAKKYIYMANARDYYFSRATIESQAYFWAQKIGQMYPRNFKVYYEDDIYVIYLLTQNTYRPYSLKVDYLEDYADEIKAKGWGTE